MYRVHYIEKNKQKEMKEKYCPKSRSTKNVFHDIYPYVMHNQKQQSEQ
jgi:hypothetical protein